MEWKLKWFITLLHVKNHRHSEFLLFKYQWCIFICLNKNVIASKRLFSFQTPTMVYNFYLVQTINFLWVNRSDLEIT